MGLDKERDILKHFCNCLLQLLVIPGPSSLRCSWELSEHNCLFLHPTSPQGSISSGAQASGFLTNSLSDLYAASPVPAHMK